MTNLNQQIAEELGYFIATDEDWHDLIHVCLCNVDGDEQIEIDTFYWFHPSSETPPESLYENIWGKTPDWENDLNLAIKLAEYVPPAFEEQEYQLIWRILSPDSYTNVFSVTMYNEYGEGFASGDNLSETFCKAWLRCIQENKEYWESE
jgi:hypothetical protein